MGIIEKPIGSRVELGGGGVWAYRGEATSRSALGGGGLGNRGEAVGGAGQEMSGCREATDGMKKKKKI